MESRLKNINLNLLFPILLVGFLIALCRSQIFSSNPEQLAIAVTLDFIITLPLIYFLSIRNSQIPKFTVFTVFIIAFLSAGFILPQEHQSFYQLLKRFLLPAVEIAVIGFILFKVRALTIELKKQPGKSTDFYDTLSLATQNIFPGRIGQLLATEIAVIYYALRLKKNPSLSESQFSYNKKSGIISIISILLLLILVETFVIHLVVEKWSVALAWILTFFSAYACLQVLALLRSMSARLIEIDEDNQVLKLRYGFFAQTYIPFKLIDRIEESRKFLDSDSPIVKLSTLGSIDSHNLILHAKEELTIHKIYGMKKHFKALAFFIDEKEKFVTLLYGLLEKEDA